MLNLSLYRISTTHNMLPTTVLYALAATLVIASEHDKKTAPRVDGKKVSNLFKRSGRCSIPTNKGMVHVQTDGDNAGWAMHYDQPCAYGTWCPFACPPGKVMNQWDPKVTSYTYPQSQYGGLYCNENGELEYPRDGDCCVEGVGSLIVDNQASDNVAFCQTVLPGNEEMLIPTNVDGEDQATLAVPDPEYWAGTAAHYYVNPPGVSVEDGCKWGTKENPWGNWSPYVAGANQDSKGNTYVKIGWNPVYLENDCPFKNTRPEFGVRITCDDGECNGLPCEIDPSKNDVNEMSGAGISTGAGGATFCVVTAENHAKATIEVFEVGDEDDKAKRGLHDHHVHDGKTTLKTVTQTKTL